MAPLILLLTTPPERRELLPPRLAPPSVHCHLWVPQTPASPCAILSTLAPGCFHLWQPAPRSPRWRQSPGHWPAVPVQGRAEVPGNVCGPGPGPYSGLTGVEGISAGGLAPTWNELWGVNCMVSRAPRSAEPQAACVGLLPSFPVSLSHSPTGLS